MSGKLPKNTGHDEVKLHSKNRLFLTWFQILELPKGWTKLLFHRGTNIALIGACKPTTSKCQ